MKFFHLGDLHFGKQLHDIQLLENDQPFWVDRFLEAADAVKPDAVVIAGDVYDRRDPSPEAMALYDRLLTGLAERGIAVLAVPGNHDSAVRLSYAGRLLETRRIYTAGRPGAVLPRVRLSDGTQTVDFRLMPYVFPKLVADALDDAELTSYDAAVRALLAAQDIDPDAVNVLVAHQNVLAHGVKPEHSESETIIGGIGEIEYSAFDAFDYVALGHIHNAQAVGRETVRYAGCPMYYDFSETGRDKSLTLVTVGGRNDVKVERVEIPLLHTLLRLKGSVDELTAMAAGIPDKERYYIEAVVTDSCPPPRARERLQAAFGAALVHIDRKDTRFVPEDGPEGGAREGFRERSVAEQFAQFYRELGNELPDGAQESLLMKIMEQQERHAGAFITDKGRIPEQDTEELISFLTGLIPEEET